MEHSSLFTHHIDDDHDNSKRISYPRLMVHIWLKSPNSCMAQCVTFRTNNVCRDAFG